MAIKKSDLKDIAFRIIAETIMCVDTFAFDNNNKISDDEVDYVLNVINKEADKYLAKIKNENIGDPSKNTTVELVNCVYERKRNLHMTDRECVYERKRNENLWPKVKKG